MGMREGKVVNTILANMNMKKGYEATQIQSDGQYCAYKGWWVNYNY